MIMNHPIGPTPPNKKHAKGIFQLTCIEVENQRYPARKIKSSDLGLFTSLEKAQKAMMQYIAEEKETEEERRKSYEEDGEVMKIYDYIFGFIITEFEVNKLYGLYGSLSERAYKANGELSDECLLAHTPDKLDEFYGRPEEEIRFKVGDIVEIPGYGKAELNIIAACPWTTEQVKKRNEEIIAEGRSPLILDSSDDCYLAYSLGVGDTHHHPGCTSVFAPTKEVSLTLKRKLWAKLIEADITWELSQHRLFIDFIRQLPKDEKLNEEVLKGLDKMADKEIIHARYRVEDIQEIMEILEFSEEQTQRLWQIADKSTNK